MLIEGKVLKKIKGFYYILSNKKVIEAKARASLFVEGNSINNVAIGDIVVCQASKNNFWIIEVKTRQNKLIRLRQTKPQVLFANVDQVFLLDPANKLNFNFIIGCAYAAKIQNIKPIIILTKLDLIKKSKLKSIQLFYETAGLEFYNHSIYDKKSTEQIRALAQNKITVLFGQSGIGKSSLLNCLFPEMQLKISNLQKNLSGKHTTSKSEIYLKENILIADSPGIQQFQFYNFDKQYLAENFFAINKITDTCHYKNCIHHTEPKCSIIEAVQKKLYPKELYQIYLNLLTKNEV